VLYVDLMLTGTSRFHVPTLGLARTIYTVYLRYYWQEKHQIYGRIRFKCAVLANPDHSSSIPADLKAPRPHAGDMCGATSWQVNGH
jgi:hypothetical protein